MIHRTRRPSRPRILALQSAILAILAIGASPLAADEVAVPDIETRIRNSGGSIPPSAVPSLESPKPIPIPEGARKGERPAVAEPPSSGNKDATEKLPAAIPTDALARPGIHGVASLGAGSPSLLSGGLSIFRERAEGPGFSLAFSHDSADGYGTEDPGSGFFDRETSASARIHGEFLPGDSSLAIGISERSDGFQGRNPDYYAMTRRALDWGYSFARVGSLERDWSLTARVGISGRIEDSFAERPSGGLEPAVPIDDYAGFGFMPSASMGLSRGDFSARIEGALSYDSVADRDSGEAKSGTVAIVASYATESLGRGSLAAEARLGALVESEKDPLVPFDCAASFASASGLVRAFSLSGGLSADRQDPFALSALEPFALLSGVPYHSADWNAKGAATFAVSGPVSFSVAAEWRSTAFARGILVVSDEADPATALAPIEYRERDSLATRASIEWLVPGIAGTAGVSDEWMDGLGRETLHALDGSITFFDRSGKPRAANGNAGPRPDPAGTATADGVPASHDLAGAGLARWEATARARLPLDSGEYPFLGLSGTVRPVPAFACTLEVADILPLATGRLRERNGLYAERSGAVILSGRFDF